MSLRLNRVLKQDNVYERKNVIFYEQCDLFLFNEFFFKEIVLGAFLAEISNKFFEMTESQTDVTIGKMHCIIPTELK
jgi:hypothetical protein